MTTSNDTTVKINLTRGYETFIDEIDNDLLLFKWCAHSISGDIYATRTSTKSEGKKTIRLHRIILSRVLGRDLLKNELVDHADLNTLNNKRDNLRLADHSKNSCNADVRLNSKTGVKGVYRARTGKYIAQITYKGKNHYLGCYDNLQEASMAYDTAAIQLFGEFALTNAMLLNK